jgi:hypothetical protein
LVKLLPLLAVVVHFHSLEVLKSQQQLLTMDTHIMYSLVLIHGRMIVVLPEKLIFF